MNERIKEFAHRCGFTEYRGDDGCDDESLTKFAELIIRECMEQVWYTREEKIDETIIPNIKTRMAKHFGVEE